MNKIILLGNMTRDPQVVRKKGQDGSDMVVTKFDLAVSRRQKGEQEADFFHCVSVFIVEVSSCNNQFDLEMLVF